MSHIALIKSNDASRCVIPFVVQQQSDLPSETLVDHQPAADESELEETRQALDRAREEVRLLNEQWQQRFDVAVAAAASEIEAKFKSDDEARISALAKAAEIATAAFREEVVGPAERIGIALAYRAVTRFGVERAADADFIADVVRAELNKLGGPVGVTVQVSPADIGNADMMERLQSHLPAGTRIDSEATIPAGTVRLRLRLGHLDVNVADGLTQLTQMLLAGAEAA